MATTGDLQSSRRSRFRQRVRTAPLWTYFLYFALVFGAIQLIHGNPIGAAISALIYAAGMTIFMRFTRNRDKKAAGGRPLTDVARLEQALGKKGSLPSDFRDRVALQSLIARKRRQVRFGAIFAPIIFGCVTILAIVNGATGTGTWWYVPVFAAATVWSVWASVRARRRLDEKEASLNTVLSAKPS